MLHLIFYFLLVILAYFIIAFCDELNDRYKRIPKGPVRFPLLGNFFQFYFLGLPRAEAMTKLSDEYGRIMKVFFGEVNGVSVNGVQAITEIMHNYEWFGEDKDPWTIQRKSARKYYPHQLIKQRKELNHFILDALREYGFGNVTIDECIEFHSNEMHSIVQKDASISKNCVEMNSIFFPHVLGVAWTLLTGKNVSVKDAHFQSLSKLLIRRMNVREDSAKILWSYPSLTKWAPSFFGFNMIVENEHELRDYFQKVFDKNVETDEDKKPDNFIQAFLKKMKEEKESSTFTEEALFEICMSILDTGVHALSSALTFSVLYAIENEKIQQKVQHEIDAVSRGKQKLSFDEKSKMPYTEATFLEVLRHACVVPIRRRYMNKSLKMNDCRVPEGTTLFINYHSAHYDTEVWDDPNTFNPERFLEADHQKVVNVEKLLSFNTGIFGCVSDPVFQAIGFMFFANALMKMNFARDHYSRNPILKPIPGLINKPHPFTSIVSQRI